MVYFLSDMLQILMDENNFLGSTRLYVKQKKNQYFRALFPPSGGYPCLTNENPPTNDRVLLKSTYHPIMILTTQM